MLAEWNRAREIDSTSNGRQQHVVRTWCKPPAQWVKINVDAACIQNADQVGAGCVARDERENFLRGRCNVVQGRFQPREAEAMGLKEALTWIKNWRTRKCIFECDAKLLVEAVNGSGGRLIFMQLSTIILIS
ncbi:uncharacterized protein LOC141665071 [Apium graveolens]|uniref:uncharacterized protein LOC141665071 n=1 Tax=Apium graveolens TaxID=4045 RepID=UPI003D7BDC0F